MKRYDISISGFDGVYLLPSELGSYVKYSDASSLLTASGARANAYKLALEKAAYEFAYGLYEEAKKTVNAALGDVTATKEQDK